MHRSDEIWWGEWKPMVQSGTKKQKVNPTVSTIREVYAAKVKNHTEML